jgi:4-hydroxybenzoate polyprenyltransferase/phosphoserine phosphatase
MEHADYPLVVDLDGTLTPADTLAESCLGLIRRSPAALLRMPFWLLAGRAGFKRAVAARCGVAAASLPYHQPLLDYLCQEKARGRRIVLATAAHGSIADDVAGHLGLFDQVLATGAGSNLKGAAKLGLIQRAVGADFVYAGDSRADLPLWRGARGAILVNASARTGRLVRAGAVPVEREFAGQRRSLAVWLRALRSHQWLKNLLLFVPLFAAYSFLDRAKLFQLALAFASFSLAASATYVVNDLWDLESDRAHPRKKLRPFASAQLPILQGLAVAGAALAAGLALAALVSRSFVLVLLLYLLLTSAYSWVLKGYMLLDVLTLSLLYTLRIHAGAVATGITASSWLLAFSVFVFLSLALVKRCSELVLLQRDGRTVTAGRDYRAHDLVVLWPLGVGAALCAVVVLGLFISAPETQARYRTPALLWLAAFGMIYWLGRLWIKTSRGEMHDDPVVYAVRDSGSRATILAIVALALAARFLTL